MSIKKPSAVESPYVTIDTTPTRLASGPIAGGGVVTVAATVTSTVSANANANADTASAGTGSNVSYYASGIEGIAGLANYGRVFAGANVYVTLEQQQYNTYNQTFTGSNIGNSISVTGNITSGEYFIGDGSQLTNIAVGTGTKILNGNSYANIASANGNLVIGINGGNTWTFDSQSTLTAPGGSSWRNAANSDAYFTSSLDGYVHLQSLFADGNIGSEMFLQHGLATITAHSLGANTDYVWTFDNGGNLTLPDDTSFQNFGPGSSEWHAGANGYVSLASNNGNTYMWVDNNGAYIATNWIPGAYQWTFDANGQTIPPALSVARGDNPSGNISGYTLNLGNGSQEAIITTPDGDADGNPNSQRIVINPGKGADTTSGEGGDIYLWAGRGGNAGGTGGDVKIRGGQGMVDGGGGYIRIEGGDSQGAGAGGYIDLIGGTSTTNTGGPIQIQSGQGVAGANIDLTGGTGTDGPGGNINITGGISANGLAEYGNIFINAGASTWTFDNTGTLNLPGGTGTVESSANNISIYSDAGQFNGMLMYDTGAEIYALQDFAIFTDNANASHIWRFYANGSMTAPGAINVGDMVIGTVPGDITANANTGVTLNVSGPDGGFSVNYLDEVGNANTSGGELAFSSETGNATYRISLSDDLGDGFATKIWRFDGTGNFNLPSGGNIVGVTAYNSGRIQWVGNSSGDGAGYTTLQLVPDDTLTGNDQYLIIDPTAPGHIHIRAGGTQDNSSADLFLGGENTHFKVTAGANNEARILANSHAWVFGADSVLTLPGEGILRSIGDVVTLQSYNVGTGNVNSVYLGSGGGLGFFDQDIGGNWLEIFRSGAEPQIRVPVGRGNLNVQTAQGINAYDWVFDNTGKLTMPGPAQLAVYANTTVRDSSITSPTPGMMIYVTGTGMQVRGATSWNTIAGSGT